MSDQPDPYEWIAYRGLIAWPERLRRETPLLRQVLEGAVARRVLDLGCGTGEHTRLLQFLGFETIGVDASAGQLDAARAEDPQGQYVQASLTTLPEAILMGSGGGICLGNTLPHLCEADDLRTFFAGLNRCLLPGSPLLLQLLNYDRILDRGERTFPVVLRPGASEGESTVFLRLMTHHGDGRLTFTPATLHYRPGSEPPLEIRAVHDVPLRGWRRAELEGPLGASGFTVKEVLGTMTGEAWTAESPDLVMICQRD